MHSHTSNHPRYLYRAGAEAVDHRRALGPALSVSNSCGTALANSTSRTVARCRLSRTFVATPTTRTGGKSARRIEKRRSTPTWLVELVASNWATSRNVLGPQRTPLLHRRRLTRQSRWGMRYHAPEESPLQDWCALVIASGAVRRAAHRSCHLREWGYRENSSLRRSTSAGRSPAGSKGVASSPPGASLSNSP